MDQNVSTTPDRLHQTKDKEFSARNLQRQSFFKQVFLMQLLLVKLFFNLYHIFIAIVHIFTAV